MQLKKRINELLKENEDLKLQLGISNSKIASMEREIQKLSEENTQLKEKMQENNSTEEEDHIHIYSQKNKH